jgi:hypothetical protein
MDLWLFREQMYKSFGRRRDTLFDLLDALSVAELVPSFVHLSLSTLFQRGWAARTTRSPRGNPGCGDETAVTWTWLRPWGDVFLQQLGQALAH